MFDQASLKVLSTLKKSIQEKTIAETGIVYTTAQKKYTVVTANAQQYLLAADQQCLVLHKDKIRFSLKKSAHGQQQAVVKNILHSSLKHMIGHFITRKNVPCIQIYDHFKIQYLQIKTMPKQLPPENSWVYCKLLSHPFQSQGTVYADIIQVLGDMETTEIEAQVGLKKFHRHQSFSQAVLKESQAFSDEFIEKQSDIDDLSEIPFVTIDAASTKDRDDAVFAQKTDTGWSLFVAIADPTAWFKAGSAIDKEAMKRGSSIYLPQYNIPLLPEVLSEDLCSLVSGKKRLALVGKIDVAEDGTIQQYHLQEAIIQSRYQLDYQSVSKATIDVTPDCAQSIDCLKALSQARLHARQKHSLVLNHPPEHQIALDSESRKISHFDTSERGIAHQIIEEAMLAMNLCSAQWLAEKKVTAPYIKHLGFRKNKISSAKKVARALKVDADPSTFAGYIELLQAAHAAQLTPDTRPFKSILSRWLSRSLVSLDAKQHFGMGFPAYVTMTSPIRRYMDIMTHRILKATLRKQSSQRLHQGTLILVQQRQQQAKECDHWVSHWLKCQYLAAQPDKHWSARITHISQFHVGVRLEENGIDAVIDNIPALFTSFSADWLEYTDADKQRCLRLDQVIQVTVPSIDLKQHKVICTAIIES